MTLGTKCVLNTGAKGAYFFTVEGEAGVPLSADGNLHEDNVSPAMANGDTCDHPRTGLWSRFRYGSQNSLGNACSKQSHTSIVVNPSTAS